MAALPERVIDLLDRVRLRLPDLPLEEKRMFGAVAVMLNGAMIVAAQTDGSLLVRVPREDDEKLLQRPEAERPMMGGRSMGVGWIRLDADAAGDDEMLDLWMRFALDRNRGA